MGTRLQEVGATWVTSTTSTTITRSVQEGRCAVDRCLFVAHGFAVDLDRHPSPRGVGEVRAPGLCSRRSPQTRTGGRRRKGRLQARMVRAPYSVGSVLCSVR